MNKLFKTLLLMTTFTVFNSQAEIEFNGFASVVGGLTTSNNQSLYGFNDSIDFKQGSLFALQASSDLGHGLSMTAQIMARGENDWDPKFEWAYLSYNATDNLRILAGKQRVPFYMYSDFLDVSYAYSWITPPPGVYSLVFDSFDGLGAIYTGQIGDFDTTFQTVYGSNNDSFSISGLTSEPLTVQPDFKNVFGGALTFVRDWLTLRTAYFRAELNIPITPLDALVAGWNQAGFSNIANNIETSKDTGKFFELGFQIDYNDFVLLGEYTDLNLDDSLFSNAESYYILAGKRIDNVLVHFTYGGDNDTKDDFTSAVPRGADAGLDYLINSTEALIASQRDKSKYITAGVRWDFQDSAALKFEYTRYTDKTNNNNDANLLKVALVTVF